MLFDIVIIFFLFFFNKIFFMCYEKGKEVMFYFLMEFEEGSIVWFCL